MSVESVVKSESYLEGEAGSPLYNRAMGITGSGFHRNQNRWILPKKK